MSSDPPLYGDQARVTVRVGVDLWSAFRVFTEDIDLWWRRGPRFRIAGERGGVVHLEPRLGGRLFESFESARGTTVKETGRITAWAPPSRMVLEWRNVNFAPDEKTEVEVVFEPSGGATNVTVTHRGWTGIRADHPARHGQPVPAFIRMMGMWWGDLLTSLREKAETR
jgi:uncharacterized protein YndB with AHSA1/START domain